MIPLAILIWFGLLTLAILNGGFREGVLVPRFGRGVSQAVSTIILSVLILLAGWISIPWIGPRTLQDAWTIGILWATFTLAFEFLAGHFIFGKPWSELLADYNLLAGRIWIMVLIITLITPIVAFTKRGL
jgi:hypothetical protein